MARKSQVTTHQDLERMTPRESREDFDRSVVTDYSVLPAGYLEKLQADMDAAIDRREAGHQQSA